ncbi:hypothetical protein AAG906_002136 [Vitis piasezkii]
MDAFRDDKIKMIGVWGMGGLGKTTLVEQVAEQAKQGKLFAIEVYIFAIATIAKALKGGSVAAWKSALEELRTSAPTSIRGVSKNVYACLELSYKHLTSVEVKSLFLLCGLLGNGHISLDDLMG